MLSRIVLAALAGVIAFLICVFVGGALAMINVPIAAFVGSFLVSYATVISILVALWSFFAGGGISFPTAKA